MENRIANKQSRVRRKTPEQLRNYLLISSTDWPTVGPLTNRDLSEHGLNNVVLRTLSILYIHKTLTVNNWAVLAVTEQIDRQSSDRFHGFRRLGSDVDRERR